MTMRQGKCMCGSISFEIEHTHNKIGACHCSMCRAWGGGGPLLSVEHKGKVEFMGEGYIAHYKSSEWAHRAFCSKCGTNLYYLMEGPVYFFSSGLFDDQQGFEMVQQIFIDEKPHFYEFKNETEIMTGAEVFALYAPKD